MKNVGPMIRSHAWNVYCLKQCFRVEENLGTENKRKKIDNSSEENEIGKNTKEKLKLSQNDEKLLGEANVSLM